jgi:hypothetical protein
VFWEFEKANSFSLTQGISIFRVLHMQLFIANFSAKLQWECWGSIWRTGVFGWRAEGGRHDRQGYRRPPWTHAIASLKNVPQKPVGTKIQIKN